MSGFWMVRAGDGGNRIGDFQRIGRVAVGWPEVGDLTNLTSLAEIRAVVARAYPDARPGNVIISGSTLHKFRSVMREGDHVVSYDPAKREYSFGSITGDYTYDPSFIENLPHVRAVDWAGSVSRDNLSSAAKNTLGSAVTIFEPGREVLAVLQKLISKRGAASTPKQAPIDETLEEFDTARQAASGQSRETLKDRLLRLDPSEMEELVAALLRSMGYKAKVTPKGPDRGRDVIASPDGLGFQKPRIFAEVKHRKEPMGSESIRSFLGGLREGDCGLYVSTGGFTKDAKYEAERAKIPITLVDLDELAALVVEHYEQFDGDGRTLLPLVKVYWPAS